MTDPWPSLPLDEWKDTYATLHRWTQIVGKIRLALSPVDQPLVARDPLRDRPRPDDVSHLARHANVSDRLRLHRPPGRDPGRRGGRADDRARATSGRGSLPRAPGDAARAGTRGEDSSDAERAAGRGPARYGSGARVVRRRIRQSLLAWAGAVGPDLHGLPRPLHRQVQPGALLLGQLRPGGDPLLGATGPGASRRRAAPAGRRHPGGLLPRGQQLRVLARWRPGALPGVLLVCLPHAGRVPRGTGPVERGLLQPRPGRVRPALRRGPAGGLAGRRAPRVPAEHVRGGGRARTLGPRGAGASGHQRVRRRTSLVCDGRSAYRLAASPSCTHSRGPNGAGVSATAVPCWRRPSGTTADLNAELARWTNLAIGLLRSKPYTPSIRSPAPSSSSGSRLVRCQSENPIDRTTQGSERSGDLVSTRRLPSCAPAPRQRRREREHLASPPRSHAFSARAGSSESRVLAPAEA